MTKQKNKIGCAVTGDSESDLARAPFRNSKGVIVGYIYLSQEVIKNIQDYSIQVQVKWDYTNNKKGLAVKMHQPGMKVIKKHRPRSQ